MIIFREIRNVNPEGKVVISHLGTCLTHSNIHIAVASMQRNLVDVVHHLLEVEPTKKTLQN